MTSDTPADTPPEPQGAAPTSRLPKTFDHAAVEKRLYADWEASGAFVAGKRPDAAPYTIVLPPPNVTGSLHVGHALNHTLQDILIRHARMTGRDALWMPGTDHAGIATQLVVERQLAQQQTSRLALGRDEFLRRVWAWKEESGGTITRQQRRLGESCDWSRERFTMDEGLSRAVTRVFVTLHRQGLMYRDKRLVNWDPSLETAVSDLEVESVEVKGHLWHLRYPVEGTDQHIVVATTRPETMLGDTAVAVHPDDERYRDLVGKKVRLPLTGRLIPIIADEYSDPEKGSGAVKITPAHDFNDFEVGRRHGLAMIAVMDRKARIVADDPAIPEAYRRLDRFEARKRIVADLDAMGLLDTIEDITHAVPHDEKSKTVVLEPFLTEQWYLDVKPLADKAIAAVERGETKFVPENWANVFFQWLRNIQPWCVSRQLWWGHQIPAWYGPDGTIFVEETETEAEAAAARHYGKAVALTRDPDVLDTWFSSALWPFSTMGWPDDTPDVARFYPTDVLVTMYDIIFFWVARMMMFGIHFTGRVPFHTVLLHARVVDEKGQKMSKTKGNVIDPLVLIDQYGADALRMALSMAATPGKDVRMGPSRVEAYRNFGTKLWNATRFCDMNGCVRAEGFDPASVSEAYNAWIIGETVRTERAVSDALAAYRFNDAAAALYGFVWNVFCDWYLEFIKPLLLGPGGPAKDETRATAAWVLDQILLMLHPFMPFITEELWRITGEAGPGRATPLIAAAWPSYPASWAESAAASEVDWVMRLVSGVRSIRSSLNVSPAAKIALVFRGASGETQARFTRHREAITRLARLESVSFADALPKGSAQLVIDEAIAGLPLEGLIDLEAERARLAKEVVKAEGEIAKVDAKLGNPQFVSRAPEEVIEEHKERRADAQSQRAKLLEALGWLQS